MMQYQVAVTVIIIWQRSRPLKTAFIFKKMFNMKQKAIFCKDGVVSNDTIISNCPYGFLPNLKPETLKTLA